MNWKPHLIIGIAAAVIVYLFYAYFISGSINFSSPTFLINCIFIIFLGGFSGLLPDIDHKQSKITRIVTILGVLVVIYVSYVSVGHPSQNLLAWFVELVVKIVIYSLAFIGLITVIRPRHRGITHTLLFTTVYAVVLYFLTYSPMLAIAGLAGYTSHLLADKCIKIV